MNNNNYKIVFCTPALYSAGGVERVVAVKANYFAEQLGYDVTIIVTEGKGRDCFFPISDKVRIVNYELNFEELWRLPFWKKVFVYLIKQRRFKKRLKADLMKIRPDFTISTLRREINFLNGIDDGSFKIGELHVNRANYRNIDTKNSNVLKRLFAKMWMNSLLGDLKRLDKMVVLTDSALKDWPELCDVVKIPDALPFRIDDKSELTAKRIISIGRYAFDKGNDLLLQAWTIIEKQMPEWTLEIYGNGDKEPYQKQMVDLGIDQQRCQLHGPVTDVKKEYLSSSVFVLPSRFEGFGLVIIESMACGVPVVAFDCENGPRSIITDGENGFLIPAFDVNLMAEKVMLLMKNQELRYRMGENAQKAASQYEMDKIGLQWKHLFDELKGQ
ncbi:Glycosyltransferase involved in cell wall bisynthesis [Xylanibacter ruminicola]|uniref:glycosyltransferase family 4 protein n=1 Tax=Xylanibacter ruminicola TaxID=839 RepID=UPI0008F09E18|nr:glycosyltransferase family 4 protein [Xylanibacter ruminicola]SFC12143.1 Glycosyltransferase involved in cell wall bisynthesis [Xylanibacter ruminicola]